MSEQVWPEMDFLKRDLKIVAGVLAGAVLVIGAAVGVVVDTLIRATEDGQRADSG